MGMNIGILVVSDRVAAGQYEDRSGQVAVEALQSIADNILLHIVPDESDSIQKQLIAWADKGMDIIFTVGGTGLSPRDVTPEATRAVIEREAPGLTTALLINGLASTPRAMLSRAVAGQRGLCLIVNLPGSVSAVREAMTVLKDVLAHAVDMMHGKGH